MLSTWLSVPDYAERYGVHRQTVQKWMAIGAVKSFRVGKVIRIADRPPEPDPVHPLRLNIRTERDLDDDIGRVSDPAEDPTPVANTRRRTSTIIKCRREAVPGCPGVYLLLRGRAIKIGCATSLQRRLRDLQIGHPDPLRVAGFIKAKDFAAAYALEHELHRRFHDEREQGEWFRFTESIADHLRAHADQWNPDA